MEGGMRLMGVRDVAAHLGIQAATVYRWAAQGKLPCVRAGDRLLFDPAAVERWIAARVRPEQSLRERRRRERRRRTSPPSAAVPSFGNAEEGR